MIFTYILFSVSPTPVTTLQTAQHSAAVFKIPNQEGRCASRSHFPLSPIHASAKLVLSPFGKFSPFIFPSLSVHLPPWLCLPPHEVPTLARKWFSLVSSILLPFGLHYVYLQPLLNCTVLLFLLLAFEHTGENPDCVVPLHLNVSLSPLGPCSS